MVTRRTFRDQSFNCYNTQYGANGMSQPSPLGGRCLDYCIKFNLFYPAYHFNY